MKKSLIESMFIWFIGAFIGSALSVWCHLDWTLGAFAGALIGIGLTVRNELWAFACSSPITRARKKWRAFVVSTTEPANAKLLKDDLSAMVFFWHCFVWPLVLLAMIPQEHSLPLENRESLGLMAFLLLFPVPALTGLIFYHADSANDKQNLWSSQVRSFVSVNFFTMPIWVLIIWPMRFAKRFSHWFKNDKAWRNEARELVVAIHSRASITAGIFCGIGALVGIAFHNPFVGGFSGMIFGYIEHWLMNRFVLPRWAIAG